MMMLLWILSFAGVVRAGEVTIIQAGQQFLSQKSEARAEQIKASPTLGRDDVVKTLKLKTGDVVTFKNLDKVTHNVYGQDFDLHAQATGDVVRQKFEKSGHQTIRCAIHPKMKFELDVEP